MTINEQCCSQATTEDIAPPASEDKNRLKVKNVAVNLSMNCKTKYKNKFNFLDVQMLSKYSSTFCFLQMFPGVTLYLYLYFLIVCLDLNCLSPQLKPSLQRGGSSASLHNSTMRNTIFQLMIHTLDPLGDGQYTRNVMMSLKCPIGEV